MTGAAIKELRDEVKRYVDKADERILKVVYAMLETDMQEDWWNDLSDKEKASIEEGIRDAKAGRVTPHSEVVKKYDRWLSK